jgi:transposase-like protein
LTRIPSVKPKLGDRGAEVLLEKVMNEILQAEMTKHLGAEPGERTDDRCGYRNGSYERELTTRIGSLKLEVPRDREGTFQTKLFERYQRSEKALVRAPYADGASRRTCSPRKEDHH